MQAIRRPITRSGTRGAVASSTPMVTRSSSRPRMPSRRCGRLLRERPITMAAGLAVTDAGKRGARVVLVANGPLSEGAVPLLRAAADATDYLIGVDGGTRHL